MPHGKAELFQKVERFPPFPFAGSGQDIERTEPELHPLGARRHRDRGKQQNYGSKHSSSLLARRGILFFMTEVAELLERLRRGPELVAASLTGAAGAEVDFRPDPEQWSLRQIVAHLADSECVGAYRFRRVIAEPNPTLEWYDEKAWAESLDYKKRKYSGSLETFRRIRAENYELLKDLPDHAWARTGVHSQIGPLTLLDLLRIYAEHAERHTRQIRRVRDAWRAAKTGVSA
jgi:hypothetical protein